MYKVIDNGQITGIHNVSNRHRYECVLSTINNVNIMYTDKHYYLTYNSISLRCKCKREYEQEHIMIYIYHYLLNNLDLLENVFIYSDIGKTLCLDKLKNIVISIPSEFIQNKIIDYTIDNNHHIKILKEQISEIKKLNKDFINTNLNKPIEDEKEEEIETCNTTNYDFQAY